MFTKEESAAYRSGYADGFENGKIYSENESYKKGYEKGYEKGMDDARSSAYEGGYEDALASSKDFDYANGYYDGYSDCKNGLASKVGEEYDASAKKYISECADPTIKIDFEDPYDVKNCPFCGSSNIKICADYSDTAGNNEGREYYVECFSCGARGPKESKGPYAVDSWEERNGDK